MIIDFGKIKFKVGCDILPSTGEFVNYNVWAKSNGLIATHQFASVYPPDNSFKETRNQLISHCMQDIFAKLAYEKMKGD